MNTDTCTSALHPNLSGTSGIETRLCGSKFQCVATGCPFIMQGIHTHFMVAAWQRPGEASHKPFPPNRAKVNHNTKPLVYGIHRLTCTHTHTHTHTHTRTRTHTHAHTRTNTHTHTHMHARTRAHTHTHTHTQTHTHSCMHADAHVRTHAHTHTHTHTHILSLTHAGKREPHVHACLFGMVGAIVWVLLLSIHAEMTIIQSAAGTHLCPS